MQSPTPWLRPEWLMAASLYDAAVDISISLKDLVWRWHGVIIREGSAALQGVRGVRGELEIWIEHAFAQGLGGWHYSFLLYLYHTRQDYQYPLCLSGWRLCPRMAYTHLSGQCFFSGRIAIGFGSCMDFHTQYTRSTLSREARFTRTCTTSWLVWLFLPLLLLSGLLPRPSVSCRRPSGP